ncbi:MAG: alginate export family protein [Acidobacteria bacterium]|nr:alginate export family protein [Acidobacteriota bacterium]
MKPTTYFRDRRHRTLVWFLLVGCVAVLGLAGNEAAAQAPAPQGQPKSAESKEKLKPVEVSVELRLRNEFRDNADFKPADDFDHSLGQRLRINLRARPHPRLTIFIQAQDVWLFDSNSDKIIHDLATNLHQAYFDWKLVGTDRWEFRGGRQELAYGEERLVGTFAWDNVGRSFDGARLRNRTGAWSNDVFWGRMVDVRRNGARARAGQQDLSGVYLTRELKGSPARVELYGLFLRDGLRTSGEIAGAPRETVRIATLGFRRVVRPKTGWRYSVENAWQFGKRGPDTQGALMLVGTAGYVWGGRRQPRVQFEYDFASGDNNPADGKSHEFHNLFPTNHPYYGYADLIGLRNLHDFRGTGAVTLHPKVILELDYHHFLLASPRGPWKNAGGRVLGFDPLGRFGRDLGHEVDLTVRLPLHKHLNFLAGYSAFVPGSFVVHNRGPETQHFAYIQTTFQFGQMR